jgi:hypothetical protein
LGQPQHAPLNLAQCSEARRRRAGPLLLVLAHDAVFPRCGPVELSAWDSATVPGGLVNGGKVGEARPGRTGGVREAEERGAACCG